MVRSSRPVSAPSTPSPARRVRLDVLLVERGLAESREKAQALVLAGAVSADGRPAEKSGQLVAPDADLAVEVTDGFVSRGGLKLDHALERFGIDVAGCVCLDVGASAGGFTDCLLRRGARRVYAVDVGRGQLDWRLRNDPRVVVRERTNIRHLTELPELIDVAVVDVSFISLRLVLPPIARLVRRNGPIVALVKPQFEAGRGQVGRGGVVRDPAIHHRVLIDLWAWSRGHGFAPRGLTASPIRGPAGNVEFLLWLTNDGPGSELLVPGSSASESGAEPRDTCRAVAAVGAALAEAPPAPRPKGSESSGPEPGTRKSEPGTP
jgi:23S rRNA (cytidine1920-2'-O)/16S rRNA (cytidine1409-2'-O)-methyltransferase